VELRSFINSVNQGRNNRERIPQTFEAFGFAVLKYLQVRGCLVFTEVSQRLSNFLSHGRGIIL
jgi:hypothetical protein